MGSFGAGNFAVRLEIQAGPAAGQHAPVLAREPGRRARESDQPRALRWRAARMGGIDGVIRTAQVAEDPLDDFRLLDAGDDA